MKTIITTLVFTVIALGYHTYELQNRIVRTERAAMAQIELIHTLQQRVF